MVFWHIVWSEKKGYMVNGFKKILGLVSVVCNSQQSAICRSILFCTDIVTDQIESVNIFLIFLKNYLVLKIFQFKW